MKKRILSLALALALVLSLSLSLAAPVSAADDGWKPLTVVDDYTTVVFSSAKTQEATVTIEDYPETLSKKVVIVTVPSGSSISVKINESIADLDESSLKNLLAMGLLGSWDGSLPKAADLVGRECHRNIQHFYEEEDGTLENEGVDYFIESGTLKLQKPNIPALNGDDGKLYLLYAAEDWAPLAYASTQSVLVDGKPVEFQCYALKDANGYDTNYVKVRDLAYVLNGTAAQFNMDWDGAVNLETGKAYTPNGSEMKTPFSGNRTYQINTAPIKVDGAAAKLESIVLTDDNGGGYTYYKFRDLGAALGFTVEWSGEKGIYIETK